jgi:hypothetical protein
MREFTKHIVRALKEDDWEINSRAIRHVKSFLAIDTDEMQPEGVPFKFTWVERMVVKHYINKLRERMLLAKFIEYSLNPRKPHSYMDSVLK